jgi:tritrans,polycis-undecaprenyl-diphosphate synthase [geranylgeranyl-diphosphate specific]
MSTITEVPRHIGIIMDGNRRFSKRLMLKPWKGHEWGVQKLQSILEWCQEYDIKELTLYTYSIQNFNRPKEEFDFLMKLFEENFERLKDDQRIFENKIRINVIGRLWMFPESLQEKLSSIMEKTKGHDGYIINLAMAYGGQEEVIDAAKRIAELVKDGKLDVKDINEQVFKDSLYLKDEPDLIIRTGGEKRVSNFLSFQSAYSEFIFLDKLFPELEKEDFVECLAEYSNRQRRFGK